MSYLNGSWVVVRWKTGIYVLQEVPWEAPYTAAFDQICKIEPGAVGEANAHFIAASPELLKTGEPILQQYKNLRAECGLTNDIQDIREAEAAIAKARGES